MASKFNTNNGPGKWACADPESASLHPIPPGQERRQLYCLQCQFNWKEPGCLFAPTMPSGQQAQKERDRERARNRASEFRSQGLSHKGEPLAHTCWNCEQVHKKGDGYVCALSPQKAPVSWQTLNVRYACPQFELRLTDVPKLVPSAVGLTQHPTFLLSESGGDPEQVAPTAEGASPPPPAA